MTALVCLIVFQSYIRPGNHPIISQNVLCHGSGRCLGKLPSTILLARLAYSVMTQVAGDAELSSKRPREDVDADTGERKKGCYAREEGSKRRD